MIKLKYHKIKNIDKTLCTCEQKIAYNIAFTCHINYQSAYDRLKAEEKSAGVIDNFIYELIHNEITSYIKTYGDNKYNVDAIQSALNAGLKNYMEKNGPIYGYYEEIGEAFPAYYL